MQVTYLSALLEKVMFSVISKEISTLNSVCCSIGELVLWGCCPRLRGSEALTRQKFDEFVQWRGDMVFDRQLERCLNGYHRSHDKASRDFDRDLRTDACNIYGLHNRSFYLCDRCCSRLGTAMRADWIRPHEQTTSAFYIASDSAYNVLVWTLIGAGNCARYFDGVIDRTLRYAFPCW